MCIAALEIETLVRERHLTSGPKTDSSQKRKANVLWIRNLPLDGLESRRNEKQILIITTNINEKLYIQYPGKESARKTKTGVINPLDFRPIFEKNGIVQRNLGFNHIWEILFQTLEPVKNEKPREICMLAALFYRMAYMLDHHPVQNEGNRLLVRDLAYIEEGYAPVNEPGETLSPPYIYNPPASVLGVLSEAFPDFQGMSVEAFLHYNEILSWVEDSKFYNRNLERKGGKWIGDTGRINTLLTHVAFIGWILNKIRLSEFLGKLAGRGVARVTRQEFASIVEPLINT